jgi:hypothetical protein
MIELFFIYVSFKESQETEKKQIMFMVYFYGNSIEFYSCVVGEGDVSISKVF